MNKVMNSDIKTTEYSIVIPVYNSEKTLQELSSRIQSEFKELNKSFELIFVDDCSQDNSWSVLQQLHKSHQNIKIIRLLKNFGQHNATLCGFSQVSGKFVITMDDDLQHPPEEIPKLIDEINKGYYVVFAKYRIKYHNKIENYFSRKYQWFIHYILGIPESIIVTGFAIFASDVIQNMISIKSSYVFLPALVQRSVQVNKIANVEVNHQPRKVGKSNYNFRKYLSLALNLIINYSVLPLLFVGVFGVIISAMSFCYGLYIIGGYLINSANGIMGWNSLMVALTFLGGMILFSIAIIGEYLRRILTEVSYGQQYVIGEMEL
jgi:glycosyltransferase involved in cell wall biosynthesis